MNTKRDDVSIKNGHAIARQKKIDTRFESLRGACITFQAEYFFLLEHIHALGHTPLVYYWICCQHILPSEFSVVLSPAPMLHSQARSGVSHPVSAIPNFFVILRCTSTSSPLKFTKMKCFLFATMFSVVS
jgi:hypothetical protein